MLQLRSISTTIAIYKHVNQSSMLQQETHYKELSNHQCSHIAIADLKPLQTSQSITNFARALLKQSKTFEFEF